VSSGPPALGSRLAGAPTRATMRRMITIADDDPRRPDVLALLGEHLADMYATTPAESVHALDPDALSAPGITFWSARDDDGALLGCAALKQLSPQDGELKSMRTATESRGLGVGAALLQHALAVAAARRYRSVHLETGAEDYFAPARRLYERAGFVACPPFAPYVPDPNSVFYALALPPRRATAP
jgi:putative acetyltransferase